MKPIALFWLLAWSGCASIVATTPKVHGTLGVEIRPCGAKKIRPYAFGDPDVFELCVRLANKGADTLKFNYRAARLVDPTGRALVPLEDELETLDPHEELETSVSFKVSGSRHGDAFELELEEAIATRDGRRAKVEPVRWELR